MTDSLSAPPTALVRVGFRHTRPGPQRMGWMVMTNVAFSCMTAVFVLPLQAEQR